MIKRSLKEIQNMVKGYGHKDDNSDIIIHGVSTDTRTIKKGQLYVPIKGEKFDGHDFINAAIDNGAVASLWCKSVPIPDTDIPLIFVDDTLTAIQMLSKEYRNEINVKVIGVTGTNGKTSTKDILGSILKTKYKTFKTKGNLNNQLGVPLTLLSLDEDTEMAVIEMGMSSLGEIEVLTKIASPDAAIITNIGNAHLEELKTRDNIIKAKLEIVIGLNPDGLFVHNGDDESLKDAVKELNIKQKTETFGEKLDNDYTFKIISNDKTGISFEIKNDESKTLFLPMLGNHQIYNAIAAIAVARHFGLSYELIEKGLLNIELTSMRSELINGSNFDILNDSYNSNPESTKAALKTMYSLKDYSQKIVVFGDMLELGEEEINMHREIGEIIDLNEIDYLFTFGDLAKHGADAALTRTNETRVLSFSDKSSLVEAIRKVIKDNSIILLKASRGMRLEEVANALLGDTK